VQDPKSETGLGISAINQERRGLNAVVVDRNANRRRYRRAELVGRGGRTQRAHLRLGQRANRIHQRRLAHSGRGLRRQDRVGALVGALELIEIVAEHVMSKLTTDYTSHPRSRTPRINIRVDISHLLGGHLIALPNGGQVGANDISAIANDIAEIQRVAEASMLGKLFRRSLERNIERLLAQTKQLAQLGVVALD
jgi:hypothetical protein